MNITQGYHLYVDAFQDIAKKYSQQKAVSDENGSLTYYELDKTSNSVAGQIISMGGRKGNRILLYVPRVKEAIVGALAIWKAGCVYVPADDAYPTERINYMIYDAECGMYMHYAYTLR